MNKKLLNPLEIYLDKIDYMTYEKLGKQGKQNLTYREVDYPLIDKEMKARKVLETNYIEFNLNMEFRANNQLQLWLDDIINKIKVWNIPKVEMHNFKRYFIGAVRTVINRNIENILDLNDIEYFQQHKFTMRYLSHNIDELNIIVKKLFKSFIMENG